MSSFERPALKPGQEWVWDYPRPPRLERSPQPVRIVFGEIEIVSSAPAWRVLETSHPPVYYVAQDDIDMAYLQRTSGQSFCEWKGNAAYYDLVVGNRRSERAAWSYPRPSPDFAALADHFAFYAGRVDACYVGEQRVQPQRGEFYGGWITDDVVGPFKGAPGTTGW